MSDLEEELVYRLDTYAVQAMRYVRYMPHGDVCSSSCFIARESQRYVILHVTPSVHIFDQQLIKLQRLSPTALHGFLGHD